MAFMSVKRAIQDFLLKRLKANLSNTINGNSQLDTIYQLAENAMANNDYYRAIQHYETARGIDPSSWKSVFFIEYCKSMCSNTNDVLQNALNLAGVSESVLPKVLALSLNDNDLKSTLLTITKRLSSASHNLGLVLMEGPRPEMNRVHELYDKWLKIFNIGYIWGNCVINIFGESMGYIAAECWMFSVNDHNRFLNSFQQWLPAADVQSGRNTVNQFVAAIRKYRSDYNVQIAPQPQSTQTQSSGGCYIATCVYGSYDCPQVWTLRRYRDDILAETWYGRLFVYMYYTLSPVIVHVFGNTNWFRKIWRKKLDKMVENLNNHGVENTPYQDRSW